MSYDLNATPMILCRTGWMDRYDGDFGTWKGRHRFVVEKRGLPHEALNYRVASNGKMYGYVQIKDGNALNIGRLGAEAGADTLENVTVVWCSQFRGHQGLRIYGWYLDATAFRDSTARPADRTFDQEILARFQTEGGNATLLEERDRTFEVPSGTMGMADHFYIDEKAPKLARRIRDYIGQFGLAETPSEKFSSQYNIGSNPEDRKKVEIAAINIAKEFLSKEMGATDVVDRQNDKCGWDLEVRLTNATLRVEVKGRGSDQPFVALTVNEYRAFKGAENDPKLAQTYRLMTIQNARSSNHTIGLFAFKEGKWRCEITQRILQPDVMELAFINIVSKTNLIHS